MMPRWNALALSLATLFAPAALAQQQANPARPGTINYVEGQVEINRQPLSSRSIGRAELAPGQVLTTGAGKAEILLTPGVFLRVGDHSAVQMVSPDLTNTRVQLEQGVATVEVDQLYKENNLLIAEDGVVTRLVQPGLYEFNAAVGGLRTFDGKAVVYNHPDNLNDYTEVKAGRAIRLTPAAESAWAADHNGKIVHKFDRDKAQNNDPLLAWSSLRSRYLANANASMASAYAGYAGFTPGWYWDPWFYGYTWLPGDGLFWDPFGWGFYSPWWIYGGGPIYGRGFGGRYGYGYHGGFVGHAYADHSFGRGGFAGGGVHGGFAGGGGFHGGGGFGGGGGFHGGGGGHGR